jgi:branched-chain amino acid transport system permease protein
VLGAGIIVLLKNVMSAYTARWLLILGIVYIVAILAAPKGIWNLGRRSASRRTLRT